MSESNVNVNHITKQKKKKTLSNEMVYGSQNKIVEMHKLANYTIGKEKLGEIIVNLRAENKELKQRLERTKSALQSLNTKIEIIERKMKTYGLE